MSAWPGVAQQSHALLDGWALRLHVFDLQAQMARAAERFDAMGFDATTNRHRHRMPAVLQMRRRLDSHDPALVGIEPANLEEEEPVGVTAPHHLAQRPGSTSRLPRSR